MALAFQDSPGSEQSPAPTKTTETISQAEFWGDYPRGSVPLTEDESGQIVVNQTALLYASLPYFMAHLRDEAGQPLIVAEHHEEWCDLLVHNPILCLLAPRDHGKSWTVISYLLWRAWKHNRDPITGIIDPMLREGRLDVLFFSETITLAGERFDTLRNLLSTDHNAWLFGDILPAFKRGPLAATRGAWAQRRVRLRNGFEIVGRGYQTSVRGSHPKIVVLDDVLSEQKTLTQYQRDKMWRYFVGTILPMGPAQIIAIGTAFHHNDLLHRLKPDKRKAPFVIANRKVHFRWVRYQAVNWDTGQVLWPEKHGIEELEGLRDADAISFSREYQNDPRDDASSLFPKGLTEPSIARGVTDDFAMPLFRPRDFFAAGPESWPKPYRKDTYEFLVLSSDYAQSAEIGADYCVVNVGSFNIQTQQRKVLWQLRGKGWGFDEQVKALRMACLLFPIDLGVMEHNSFQRWVKDEIGKYPETAGRIVGHNTGPEKQSLEEGVPSMAITLSQGLWTFSSGSKAALRAARIWQTEMSAFGWKDGKLQGVGEHDDTVIAFWLLERAIRTILTILRMGPQEQHISLEDMGIDRVHVGTWDNPFAYGG